MSLEFSRALLHNAHKHYQWCSSQSKYWSETLQQMYFDYKDARVSVSIFSRKFYDGEGVKNLIFSYCSFGTICDAPESEAAKAKGCMFAKVRNMLNVAIRRLLKAYNLVQKLATTYEQACREAEETCRSIRTLTRCHGPCFVSLGNATLVVDYFDEHALQFYNFAHSDRQVTDDEFAILQGYGYPFKPVGEDQTVFYTL